MWANGYLSTPLTIKHCKHTIIFTHVNSEPALNGAQELPTKLNFKRFFFFFVISMYVFIWNQIRFYFLNSGSQGSAGASLSCCSMKVGWHHGWVVCGLLDVIHRQRQNKNVCSYFLCVFFSFIIIFCTITILFSVWPVPLVWCKVGLEDRRE